VGKYDGGFTIFSSILSKHMITRQTKNRHGKFIFTVLVFLNSFWIFYTYLSITQIGTFEPAALSDALEGTAEQPYVLRALIPLLAKFLSPLLPSAWVKWLASAPSRFKESIDVLSGGVYFSEAVSVLTLMFLSLVGFAYAEKRFLKDLGANPKEQFVLPLLAQIFILPFSLFFAYYYDLPQIFLITLNLIFLHRGNWKKYLITFALASLNKETSLFLIMVFIIYYLPRLPRKTFVELLITQTAIYALIRVSLLYIFRSNPGAPAFLTLSNQYKQYSAYPSTLIFTVVLFSIIGFLVVRGWQRKHPFLRATSVIAVLILILFFTSGMPMEFRVFLDALPALVILIFPPFDALPSNS
jgi:hypothetical protein